MTKIVEIQTSVGNIRVELNEEKAPNTVANFLEYVNSGFYEGVIFHRVIKGFVIQTGGFKSGMKHCLRIREPIQNEANNEVSNKKYTISMARTSAPHSASSQFFINTANNDFLDFKSETITGWGYAVFGKVIEGMDVVDLIEKAKTGRISMHMDVPLEEITILKTIVI